MDVFFDNLKKSSDGGFFLSNRKGNYLALRGKNVSHYEGFFVFDAKSWELFKVVESLSVDSESFEVRLFPGRVERRSSVVETFRLSSNALLYEVSGSARVNVNLDMRFVHDFSSVGRIYEVFLKDGCVLVKYSKFSDDSLSSKSYEGFLLIGSPDGPVDVDFVKRWVPVDYGYDKRRGSSTVDFVFNLGFLKAHNTRFVFVFSTSESKVWSKLRYVLDSYSTIVDNVDHSRSVEEWGVSIEERVASRALNNLTVRLKNGLYGVFAGLPWFYQIYTRDEALSLIGLLLQERYLIVKDILFRHLENLLDDGRLPDRYPPANIGSADGVGWVLKRVRDFVEVLSRKGLLSDVLTPLEIGYLRDRVSLALERLELGYLRDGLFWNGPKETWMDTDGGVFDSREGFRVEVQALMLSGYSTAALLHKLSGGDYKRWKFKERSFLSRVRSSFFVNDFLCDSPGDCVARPNAFLAAYVYPGLLSSSEWRRVFNRLVSELWLPWGGFSSISKSHEFFTPVYSGVDNRSYHRGDSWFFVNNIAALVLKRLGNGLFDAYVSAVKDASVNDLLFNGWFGQSSEISSAEFYEPVGCFAQAWSAATLLELLVELRSVRRWRLPLFKS